MFYRGVDTRVQLPHQGRPIFWQTHAGNCNELQAKLREFTENRGLRTRMKGDPMSAWELALLLWRGGIVHFDLGDQWARAL